MAMILSFSTSVLSSRQIKSDVCLVNAAKNRVVLASVIVSLSSFGEKKKKWLDHSYFFPV